MSISILIADDQQLVRSGFRMILESEDGLEVVGEAGDGKETVSLAHRLKPDVALVDLRMPVMDGIAATKEITGAGLQTRVLVVTTFDTDDFVYAALRAGASGFLLKDAPPEELAAAVRVVAGGDALLAPSVTRRLIEEFTRISREPRSLPGLEDLTTREIEVLRLMARGLSNGEIAQELTIGETTVKTHVGNILLKLDARDRAQVVVAAYESGLVQPGSMSPNA